MMSVTAVSAAAPIAAPRVAPDAVKATASASDPAARSGPPSAEIRASDVQRVTELRSVDRAVRAHEAAHLAAGSGVVSGGARFTYVVGPDGQRYAVGGEVPIDASKARTPEATVDKARALQRAALAPGDPSAQDRRVAALAARMEADALAAIARDAAAVRAGAPGAGGSDADRPSAVAGASAVSGPSDTDRVRTPAAAFYRATAGTGRDTAVGRTLSVSV